MGAWVGCDNWQQTRAEKEPTRPVAGWPRNDGVVGKVLPPEEDVVAEVMCRNCRWFDPEEDDNGDPSEKIGTCRIRSVFDHHFPQRYPNEWCGEFSPQTPEKT